MNLRILTVAAILSLPIFSTECFPSPVLRDLIKQIEGCGGTLSRKDALQSLILPKSLITTNRADEFIKAYAGLQVESSGTKNVEINVAKLPEDQKISFLADVIFLKRNPGVPIENLCATLETYDPKNDSQRELLTWSKKIVEYRGNRASGLAISGSAGVGKSHVSVAVAKEFLKRGENPLLITGKQISLSEKDLATHQVFIFDDLNSGYGADADVFLRVVSYVHDHGGKILLTTNATLPKLMDEMVGPYSVRKNEGPRFQDRTKNLFKVLDVKGESGRTEEAWFN